MSFDSTAYNAYAKSVSIETEPTDFALQLKDKERKLWLKHILWTRHFIVSYTSDLEDKEIVLARLLKNEEDIGNTIKPYYGEDEGNQFTALLREHVVITKKVAGAVKAKNEQELDKQNELWHRNADDLTEFLNHLNPDWSTNGLRETLYGHLQLVTEQLTARVNGAWEADLEACDKGEEHMLMLADTLSSGIIRQFPDKFACH